MLLLLLIEQGRFNAHCAATSAAVLAAAAPSRCIPSLYPSNENGQSATHWRYTDCAQSAAAAAATDSDAKQRGTAIGHAYHPAATTRSAAAAAAGAETGWTATAAADANHGRGSTAGPIRCAESGHCRHAASPPIDAPTWGEPGCPSATALQHGHGERGTDARSTTTDDDPDHYDTDTRTGPGRDVG